MRALFLILCCCMALSAKGQYAYTGYGSGNFSIAAMQDISITNLAGAINLGAPDEYLNGKVITNFATIYVKSNVNWQLSVNAQAANFSAMSTGASSNMPSTVLGIRITGTTQFLNLTTGSQSLKTGVRGSNTVNGNTLNTDVRFAPGFNYGGGSYSIVVRYTLTQL